MCYRKFPGGVAGGGDAAAVCSPYSSDFNCEYGQNCFAVKMLNEKCDVNWGPEVSGFDGNGSKVSVKECKNWVNNDVNSCRDSPSKPAAKRWIACGLGSSPGGISEGNKAGVCSPYSSGPDNFSCKYGQNCFAVTNLDVNWGAPATGCDGDKNKVTIQKCSNWINNDPRSCLDSPSKPAGTTKWAKCAIGSSQAGLQEAGTLLRFVLHTQVISIVNMDKIVLQ